MSRISATLFAAGAALLAMMLAAVAFGAVQAAPARDPDIRGLRLGVALDDVRARFDGAIAEWKQDWRPEAAKDPLLRRTVRLTLADRANVEIRFASAINGGRAFLVMYEQTFRDGQGPAWQDLKARIEAKYGSPDKVIFREGSTAFRSTYELPSRATGPLGAFLKPYFDFDAATGRVRTFRLVLHDAALGVAD
ncbi:MAG: hypothetical protein IT561_16880, partial [Alphaproteobacteria bacterium]|nr:hypothetical protein [Alphaproteobacteria bacterium]